MYNFIGRANKDIACVADDLNPGIVHLRISDQKLVPPPPPPPLRVTLVSIIGSNWLLHMAVFSCTMIGRVDLLP